MVYNKIGEIKVLLGRQDMATYIINNRLNTLVPLTSQRLGFLAGMNVASAPDTAGGNSTSITHSYFVC
jgi:hypothetical protein